MAKSDEGLEDMVAATVIASMEGAIKRTYRDVLAAVKPAYDKLKRQRDGYAQKAQAYDIAVKYLRNGATEVSDADKEKVTPAYARTLTTVVGINKRLKEAKGLKSQVDRLEKQKAGLENSLESQRKKYEAAFAKLDTKYKKAEFVVKQLEKLYQLEVKDYEKAIADEKTDEFVASYAEYDGKLVPVIARPMNTNILLIQARDRFAEYSAKFKADIKAAISDNPPEPGDSGPGKKKSKKRPGKK